MDCSRRRWLIGFAAWILLRNVSAVPLENLRAYFCRNGENRRDGAQYCVEQLLLLEHPSLELDMVDTESFRFNIYFNFRADLQWMMKDISKVTLKGLTGGKDMWKTAVNELAKHRLGDNVALMQFDMMGEYADELLDNTQEGHKDDDAALKLAEHMERAFIASVNARKAARIVLSFLRETEKEEIKLEVAKIRKLHPKSTDLANTLRQIEQRGKKLYDAVIQARDAQETAEAAVWESSKRLRGITETTRHYLSQADEAAKYVSANDRGFMLTTITSVLLVEDLHWVENTLMTLEAELEVLRAGLTALEWKLDRKLPSMLANESATGARICSLKAISKCFKSAESVEDSMNVTEHEHRPIVDIMATIASKLRFMRKVWKEMAHRVLSSRRTFALWRKTIAGVKRKFAEKEYKDDKLPAEAVNARAILMRWIESNALFDLVETLKKMRSEHIRTEFELEAKRIEHLQSQKVYSNFLRACKEIPQKLVPNFLKAELTAAKNRKGEYCT